MEFLTHVSLFVFSIFVVWFFAGILISSISRVARRLRRSGFAVAFFVLGLLTSISEISVALNSSINRVPQVSAGNLVGSSFVLLLFLVPLLAIVGNGIRLTNTFTKKSLLFALMAVLFPVLASIDGVVTPREGGLMLVVYFTLMAFIRRDSRTKTKNIEKAVEQLQEELTHKRRPDWKDAFKIMIGAAAIFYAAHLLVEEAVYFAEFFHAPASLMGLLLLSIGTNVPEIIVAVRSVMKRQKAIAFGNYMGSAVANTLVFGALPLLNGRFALQLEHFGLIAMLLAAGFVCFFFSAFTKHQISRAEGIVLLVFYVAFLAVQSLEFWQCATCG